MLSIIFTNYYTLQAHTHIHTYIYPPRSYTSPPPRTPRWYVDLCPKTNTDPITGTTTKGLTRQPSLISTLRRVTPKLLRLAWERFPLYYDARKHGSIGWGYLVPGRPVVGSCRALSARVLSTLLRYPDVICLCMIYIYILEFVSVLC